MAILVTKAALDRIAMDSIVAGAYLLTARYPHFGEVTARARRHRSETPARTSRDARRAELKQVGYCPVSDELFGRHVDDVPGVGRPGDAICPVQGHWLSADRRCRRQQENMERIQMARARLLALSSCRPAPWSTRSPRCSRFRSSARVPSSSRMRTRCARMRGAASR